jgi:hypothetical protein
MGLFDSLKRLFGSEEGTENAAVAEENTVHQADLEIDEEDRVVVALAASVMAGKDKSGSHYHISNIRRIK